MNNMQGEDGGLPPHHRQCAWTHQGGNRIRQNSLWWPIMGWFPESSRLRSHCLQRFLAWRRRSSTRRCSRGWRASSSFRPSMKFSRPGITPGLEKELPPFFGFKNCPDMIFVKTFTQTNFLNNEKGLSTAWVWCTWRGHFVRRLEPQGRTHT